MITDHAYTQTRRTEAGVALLLALLAMSIVGGIAHRLMLHADTYRAITRTFADSITTQQDLREGLDPRPPRSRGCARQQTSIASARMREWLVCSRGNPAFISNRLFSLPDGRVDYNTLLANPSACPGQRSSSAEPFTTSPSSGDTCELPAQLAQDLAILDNIRCRDLVMESPVRSHSLRLATPGSLVCDGTVTLSASTLIVAGGDIRIASLRTRSSSPLAVTLLSAHGAIVIGNSSGPISILALGRDLLSVPVTGEHPAFLLPPFTAGSIAGVKLLD